MKCKFQVGDKVVCVWDRPKIGPQLHNRSLYGLTAGCVYTISAVIVQPYWDDIGVLIEEIDLANAGRPLDAFDHRRFRKINDNRLAAFRRLLVKPPEEVVS